MGGAVKTWLPRIVWLGWGGLTWYAMTDTGAPWWVLVLTVISAVAFLGVGVWWVKRSAR